MPTETHEVAVRRVRRVDGADRQLDDPVGAAHERHEAGPRPERAAHGQDRAGAVGIGAAIASVLRLPLSAVVLALLLTFPAGPGASPLIIVGTLVAYLTSLALSSRVDAPAPAS